MTTYTRADVENVAATVIGTAAELGLSNVPATLHHVVTPGSQINGHSYELDVASPDGMRPFMPGLLAGAKTARDAYHRLHAVAQALALVLREAKNK